MVGHDAFAVIRETIRNMDMVALPKVAGVFRGPNEILAASG